MSNIYKMLKQDYKQALKDKNPLKSFINMVIADIDTYAKSSKIEEINDTHALLILKRISKKLNETITQCKNNGRESNESNTQLEYISKFIPSLVQGEDLKVLIEKAQSGYSNISDIMKFLSANNADMKQVKTIINFNK